MVVSQLRWDVPLGTAFLCDRSKGTRRVYNSWANGEVLTTGLAVSSQLSRSPVEGYRLDGGKNADDLSLLRRSKSIREKPLQNILTAYFERPRN